MHSGGGVGGVGAAGRDVNNLQRIRSSTLGQSAPSLTSMVSDILLKQLFLLFLSTQLFLPPVCVCGSMMQRFVQSCMRSRSSELSRSSNASRRRRSGRSCAQDRIKVCVCECAHADDAMWVDGEGGEGKKKPARAAI